MDKNNYTLQINLQQMRQEKGRKSIKAKALHFIPGRIPLFGFLSVAVPCPTEREEQDPFPSYPATLNSLRVGHGEMHDNKMSLMCVGWFEMFSLTLLAQASLGTKRMDAFGS